MSEENTFVLTPAEVRIIRTALKVVCSPERAEVLNQPRAKSDAFAALEKLNNRYCPSTDKAYVIRYVLTHVWDNGLRGLTEQKQGRRTYATREEADRAVSLLVKDIPTLEARAALCQPYAPHDPISTWFE